MEIGSLHLLKLTIDQKSRGSNNPKPCAYFRYKLLAFISHMGSSPQSGHYVCHVREEKEDRWLIFNDNKVAVSGRPPKQLGYLYLYRRCDS